MSQLNLDDLCEQYAPRAFAFLSKLKFGEMLAYFKPFRRRSSVFRQAENSRFSWGINIQIKDLVTQQQPASKAARRSLCGVVYRRHTCMARMLVKQMTRQSGII